LKSIPAGRFRTCTRWPSEPVGACIEPRRQNDRLTDARACRIEEEVIDKSGADRHHARHSSHPELGASVDLGGIQLTRGEPREEFHSHRAHQRLGERIVDQGVGCSAGQGSTHRHGGRDGPHASRQIPGVVLGARHTGFLLNEMRA
jgi:hypothetical protein